MKIVHITNHLKVGGISSYVRDYAVFLKKDNHNVWVCSSGGDVEKELIKNDVQHFYVPLNTKSILHPKIIISAIKISNMVKENKIQVIHSHTHTTQVCSSIVSKICHIPHLSTCHGFFRKNIGRRLFPCWGKYVVAISPAVKSTLINNWHLREEKIKLISTGIDTSRFKPTDSNGKKGLKTRFGFDKWKYTVGTLGRLSPVKGIRWLIEAIPLIPCDAGCVIAGDGPEKESLKRLVKKLNIENRIIFIEKNFKPEHILPLFDIYVAPSISEGLGLSVLEAISSGVPVIGTRVGGIQDIIKNKQTGLLVEPKNPRAIADAINTYIKSPKEAEKISKDAFEYVRENFSIQNSCSKLVDLYQALLGLSETP